MNEDFITEVDASTQRGQILEWMKTYGSITTREAATKLFIMSPRKRLSEINEKIGLNKEVCFVSAFNPATGKTKKKRIIKYSLHES